MVAVLVPTVLHVAGFDWPPAGIRHRTFYVSPDGDDAHDGRSPGSAWQTLTWADTVGFRPGDRLLLRGGARLPGSITIAAGEAGDAGNPVVVDSYGVGRATIETSGRSGITVYNTGGVTIRNLNLIGEAGSFNTESGVKLYTDLPGGRKPNHVYISGVDVTGFRTGIEIGSGTATSGFRDVDVRDSVLHGNRDSGLKSYGPRYDRTAPGYAHERVSVRNVVAHDNLGNPNDPYNNSGNGIVLGSVRDGLVERSTAHDNGAKCRSKFGPVGIWAYDSTGIVIQHNIAFHNHTSGRADGGGFDLDTNVSSSVMQYNLSYQNDGPGYLVFGVEENPNRDNTVRFNISHDDARKLPHYAGLQLQDAVINTHMYNNTVTMSANGSRRPPALRLAGTVASTPAGSTIRNNILVSNRSGLLLVDPPLSTDEVLFQGNDMFAVGGPWFVQWGSTEYHDMSRWRAATGQERAGARVTGFSVDPRFVGAAAADRGLAGTFALSARSALLGKALDLRAMFGVDPGPVDYFGRPIRGTVGAIQESWTK